MKKEPFKNYNWFMSGYSDAKKKNEPYTNAPYPEISAVNFNEPRMATYLEGWNSGIKDNFTRFCRERVA